MIWAAMCSDPSVPRPIVIWEPETPAEKEELQKAVIKDNEVELQRAQAQQRKATEEGTEEYNQLKAINDEILRANQNLRAKYPGIRKGIRRLKKPKQVFKHEIFTRGVGKGLGAVWYANRILKEALYPYYCNIRRANPDKEVYLIEDNVRLHHGARRKLSSLHTELGVKFVDRPTRSPDLHPIERCFGQLEGFLGGYQVDGQSKKAKAEARKYVEYIWKEDEEMGEYILDRASNDTFLKLAKLCKDHRGSNNFTG